MHIITTPDSPVSETTGITRFLDTVFVPLPIFDELVLRVTTPHTSPVELLVIGDTVAMSGAVYVDLLDRADWLELLTAPVDMVVEMAA